MNNLLALTGGMRGKRRKGGGALTMNKTDALSWKKVQRFRESLLEALSAWPDNAIVADVLLDVYYDAVVPKSSRAKLLLKELCVDEIHGIVGARYGWHEEGPHHILTYYLTRGAVRETIDKLSTAIEWLQVHFPDDVLRRNEFAQIGSELVPPQDYSPSCFKQLLHDCIHLEYAAVPDYEGQVDGVSLVSIFPTEVLAGEVLSFDNPLERRYAVVDDTTLLLAPHQFAELVATAPYLVTMTSSDSYDIGWEDGEWEDPLPFEVPEPDGEPTVGVIDTVFSESSPLASWVKAKVMLPDGMKPLREDYEHGTRVSSLIVAGHELNPGLDDGCGWFQVRHFGVALSKGNSTSRLMADVRGIVADNPDIRVWNLSLGRHEEVSENVVSPLAACLDAIQAEYDVLFVVAGTNDPNRMRSLRVGSPADSLNSLVVNSVRRDGLSASYTRRGPVLSFFNKPDVAYYGGDDGEFIKVLDDYGVVSDFGTSLAAPWIARKAAYLIEVLHLPRDVAKALLINSALSWDIKDLEKGADVERGYGLVPRHIDDVVKVPNDEIRFYVSGRSDSYEMYSLGLPVPLEHLHYPYAARAVLCYSPWCDKRQGVDYTNTELSLVVGRQEDRIDSQGNPYIGLLPAPNRFVSAPEEYVPYEEAVRAYKRKWDNVKVSAEAATRARPKEPKSKSGFWGISIKKTERLDDRSGQGLPFGVVITLKALDGKNRIEDFIQQCIRVGWRVREIRPEQKRRINLEAQTEISFE
ncbi:S8 family peptidase [uncultured Adlercreutzia sp.]|uniref:S8 family peptidase n=1 Tax=uncultured Adlercreutzia sp. TaxID=875803 RepID=UPI0026F3BAD6|nr:S8 family peptidase [uncultured Adlercreutzia sp.]